MAQPPAPEPFCLAAGRKAGGPPSFFAHSAAALIASLTGAPPTRTPETVAAKVGSTFSAAQIAVADKKTPILKVPLKV